ncbi:MAG TPA: hypothetical protein VMN57_12790 [Anaerolineales bacterium]|nr:hypothetical protein [Anaerolineales bacterium]
MKKTLFILAITGVAVLALGIAGYAYAQTQTPTPFTGYGPGMMGDGFGPGMMGGEMDALHEIMHPAMATALGLSSEEFDARHSAGETFWDIAEAQGLTTDEAWTLMQTSRDTALDQAVDDGVVSREFANGMRIHMDGMLDGDFAPGSGHCDR